MRSMIVSLCFFILSLTTVAVNSYFVTSYLGQTIELLEQLPSEIGKDDDRTAFDLKAREITDAWNKRLSFLSLSINIAELRDCTIALENFASYTVSDDPSDYSSNLSEALLRIKTLYYREKILFSNII